MENKNLGPHPNNRWTDKMGAFYHPPVKDEEEEDINQNIRQGDLKPSPLTMTTTTSTQKNSVRFINHKTVEIDKFGSTNLSPLSIHKTLSWTTAMTEMSQKSHRPYLRPRRSIQNTNTTSSSSSTKKNDRAPLTLRNVLLDRTLNVENLAVGEFQEIHVEPSDPLYLPALKIFSWHAESNDTNYSDIDSSEDEEEELMDEDEGITSKHGLLPHSNGPHYHRHQGQEEFEQKKRQAVYQILEAAPNLELIKDFNFESDYAVVMAAKKVACVQHLCLFDTVNVDHLLEFLTARPHHLKTLQLVNHPSDEEDLKLETEEAEKLAQAIKQLFLFISDTLEVLDLSQFCSSVDLQIPHKLRILYQLKLGSVIGQTQPPSRCLPRQIFLNKTFPHVTVLDVSGLQMDSDGHWDFYFPSFDNFEGNFESVKVIVISDQCSHVWMDRLHGLCPNFDKLVLISQYEAGGRWINFMLWKIFRYWKHLKFLEVRLDDFPTTTPLTFSLDSAFLGMREQTCKRLRMAAEAAGGNGGGKNSCACRDNIEKSISMQPIRCSIANLHLLKKLDLIFGHDCVGKLAARLPTIFDPEDEDLDKDQPPLLSSISCRYGFSNLAALKVNLIFDHNCPWGKEIKKKLDPLSCSFVRLTHRDDSCCSLRNHHYQHQAEAGVGYGGGVSGVRVYGYP